MKKLIVFVLCFVLFVGNAHAADTWGAAGETTGDLGSELLTGGDFASSSGWTLGSGWSIGSGVATHGSGAGSLKRSVSVTAGSVYVVEVDTIGTNPEDKSYRLKMGGVEVTTYGSIENEVASTSLIRGSYVAPSTASVDFEIDADDGMTFSFDNATVKEVSTLTTPLASLDYSAETGFAEIRGREAMRNLFLGKDSGKYTVGTIGGGYGYDNIGIGRYVMKYLTLGYQNVAVGEEAMAAATTAASSTAVGYQAMVSNTSGFNNTAIGARTLHDNTYGAYNTALGFQALYKNTYGIQNIGIGQNALYGNTTGKYNTAIGGNALSSTSYTGNSSIAIGQDALKGCTSGSYNQAIGHGAMEDVTTGSGNTCYGHQCLNSLTTSNDNTVLGYQAGSSLTSSANNNIFIGSQSGYGQTGGSDNICIADICALPNTSAGGQLNIGNLYRGDLDDGVAMLGTTTVSSYDASLELGQTNRALILNRLTTTQMNAITDPENGMVIYNTTTGKFTGYAGGAWVALH